MASGVNKAIVIGRLGRDPEAMHTGHGNMVTTLSVATESSSKGQDGQWVQQTDWHRIVVWGRQAEMCVRHLRKGSQVYAEGRMQQRKWSDRDGAQRVSFEIIAHTVQFLGSKSSSSEQILQKPEQPDNTGWDTQNETPF